jgi:hypothetical protein
VSLGQGHIATSRAECVRGALTRGGIAGCTGGVSEGHPLQSVVRLTDDDTVWSVSSFLKFGSSSLFNILSSLSVCTCNNAEPGVTLALW